MQLGRLFGATGLWGVCLFPAVDQQDKSCTLFSIEYSSRIDWEHQEMQCNVFSFADSDLQIGYQQTGKFNFPDVERRLTTGNGGSVISKLVSLLLARRRMLRIDV